MSGSRLIHAVSISILPALLLSLDPLFGAALENSRWSVTFDDRSGSITRLAARPAEGEDWAVLFERSDDGACAGITVYDVASGRTFRPGAGEIELLSLSAGDSLARPRQRPHPAGPKRSPPPPL